MPAKQRRILTFTLVFLAGITAGAFLTHGPSVAQGDDHQAAKAGIKAPLAEALHCPLAFAGVHLQNDDPSNAQVAYHFCSPLNEKVSQCILYDGTGPKAKLIGIEYLVTDDIYRAMPEEERAFWHDHKHEVDARLIRSLTQHGEEEAKTLAQVRTLWGKVYHTWAAGENYPQGPAKLFWSVTGEKPYVLRSDAKLPPEIKAADQPKAAPHS